jgi:hypothetical protein
MTIKELGEAFKIDKFHQFSEIDMLRVEVRVKEGKRQAFDKKIVGIFYFLRAVFKGLRNCQMSDIFKISEKDDTIIICLGVKRAQTIFLDELYMKFKRSGIIENIEVYKSTPSV